MWGYSVTPGTKGTVSFVPKGKREDSQQFSYSPITELLNTSDSFATALTIGSISSSYTQSITRGFFATNINTDIVVIKPNIFFDIINIIHLFYNYIYWCIHRIF